MCSQDTDDRPGLSATIRNLRQDLPWAVKVRLLMRNNLIKARSGSSCCGNYGEPGC